jgi:N-acetylglucosamine-6-phosphate deacetylase
LTRRPIAAECVVTGDERIGSLAPGAVWAGDDGRIIEVLDGVPADADVLPGYLVPGFVDIHSHGGGGATTAEADTAAIRTFVRSHLQHGTTTILASLASSHPQRLVEDVTRLAAVTEAGVVAGTHLEGPWISPAMAGAHDPATLRPPDPREVEQVLAAGRGTVRMVTLAPELAGGIEAVRTLTAHGVVAAFGHSDADWARTTEAIDAGCAVATHLFNRMRGIHHRDPGPVPALLADDRMHVELIADGVHVHPAVIAMVRQAVPPSRIALVTDAMAPAGIVANGEPPSTAGVLAGSALTMDAAVRRVVSECGFSLADAVQAASVTPARIIGASDVGSLAPGKRADLVHLDRRLVLQQVWRAGIAVEPSRDGVTDDPVDAPGSP